MSQYGANQNTPYTGQQDSDLVNNPRYQGQSGGTVPQGATGPQQESRYGAAPLSTTGIQHGHHHGTGQGGYGAPPTSGGYGSDPTAQAGYGGGQSTGGYGANPNAQSGFGSQTGYGSQPTTGGYGTERAAGLIDPNTRPNQAGYGSQPTGGYGTHHQGQSEFAKEQPGYGQPGFGAPSEGQNTGALWPQPASPPNAHRHDLINQGQGGYGQQQSGQGGYGQGGYGEGGYDQPPRKEGVMDKVKDAVGMGPRSQGAAPGQQGYNPNVNHPSEETGFGGGYGQHPHGGRDQLGGGYNTGMATGADAYTQSQPRNEGIVDKAKDAVGMGPNSGYNSGTATGGGAYTQSQPRNEGIVDKAKDAVGMGPNSGYNSGTTTGGGAYTQSQPRREGIVDKAKDAVGMGPNSGYDARTQTGNDAYVHGNHPVGMQDRVQGVNEPTLLGGEHGVHAPVGSRDGVLRPGEYVPESMIGETRTEPGYDSSKGHLSGQGGHHHTLGETGLGGHHNTDIDERRGKGFEDSSGPYDSKLSTGTGTGTHTGTDTYDETTGTGSGYDDTTTGTAPKKGLMTKIKEKMHH